MKTLRLLGVLLLLPSAPLRADVPALFGAPQYPAAPGGFEREGGTVKPRCDAAALDPERAVARLEHPDAKEPDASLCKRQVWDLLRLKERWNSAHFVAKGDWDNYAAPLQRKKLLELRAYFLELDRKVDAALIAGNGVLIVHQDKGGAEAVKEMPRFHAAMKALGEFAVKRGGVDKLAPGDGAMPEEDFAKLKAFLEAQDNVLAEHLAKLRGYLQKIGTEAASAAPRERLAATTAQLGKDKAAWESALKADDGQTLNRMFENAARQPGNADRGSAAGREALSKAAAEARPQLYQAKDGSLQLMQTVMVPVPGKPGESQAHSFFTGVRDDDSLETASRRLADNLLGDKSVLDRFDQLAAAAKAAAPAQVARDVREESGVPNLLGDVTAGATENDYKRKLESERSQEAAKATALMNQAQGQLRAEWDEARAACGRMVDEIESTEGSIKRQVAQSRLGRERGDGVLTKLKERRAALRVNGPTPRAENGAPAGARPQVACAREGGGAGVSYPPVDEAYGKAQAAEGEAYQRRVQAAEAVATGGAAKLTEQTENKVRLRRWHFRVALLEIIEKADLPFSPELARLDLETRKDLARQYYESVWVEYLEGWDRSEPKTPADLRRVDERVHGKESDFIDLMAAQVPYVNTNEFQRRPPPPDADVVKRGYARKYIHDDYLDWIKPARLATSGPARRAP